jgi:quercetin dioxygenase-like cupin family protein
MESQVKANKATLATRWAIAASLALAAVPGSDARAQDAVAADPAHYTVEFENERVRVLRVVYGPHEKSVMHEHPDSVAVYLTDGHLRITLPDGRTGEPHVKAGQSMWHPAGAHLIENLGSTPFELVLTEIKSPATPVR